MELIIGFLFALVWEQNEVIITADYIFERMDPVYCEWVSLIDR